MTKPRRLRRWNLAAVGAAVAVILYAWLVETRWVEVTHATETIGLESPIRVAHLTDLHTRGLGAAEERVFAILEDTKPDLIAITGDTVDGGNWEAARPVLSRLRAPLGVFLVDGNWEHWSMAHAPSRWFAALGVRRLDNEAVRVRGDLHVVGIDDRTGGSPKPAPALEPVPKGGAALLLFHSPIEFDVVAPMARERCGASRALALAGHTHGGQIRLPWLGAIWTPPGSGSYVEGGYALGEMRMRVSRGIGTSVVPMRLACRPEVSIVTLR